MGKRGRTNGGKPAGAGVRFAGKGGPQIARTGGSYWTDEAEGAFLDALGASCNVRTAAAAIGYTTATLYWRRRRDPAFAERWQAALSQGYSRIEALLLERAEDALEGRMPDPTIPIPAMTVKEAMELLRMHHAAVNGRGPRTPGRPARVRTIDEVRGSIRRKIAAIKNAREAAGVGAGAIGVGVGVEPAMGAGSSAHG